MFSVTVVRLEVTSLKGLVLSSFMWLISAFIAALLNSFFRLFLIKNIVALIKAVMVITTITMATNISIIDMPLSWFTFRCILIPLAQFYAGWRGYYTVYSCWIVYENCYTSKTPIGCSCNSSVVKQYNSSF